MEADGPGLLSLFLELPKLCFVHEARKATHLQNLGMNISECKLLQERLFRVKNHGANLCLARLGVDFNNSQIVYNQIYIKR